MNMSTGTAKDLLYATDTGGANVTRFACSTANSVLQGGTTPACTTGPTIGGDLGVIGTLGVTGALTVVSTASSIAQPTWTNLSYATGWGDNGGGFTAGSNMKDSMGFVHLRGLAKYTSGGTTTIAVLPNTGYRPATYKLFPVDANNAYGSVQIYTDGSIVSVAGSTNYVSLENIMFDTR